MSIITVTSTINYAYLMNKSKTDLAYMYLDLLELRVKDEAENAALKAQADKLAAALEQSIYGLKTIIESCDGKFPDGSYEQGAINSMKMNLILSHAALADWRKDK